MWLRLGAGEPQAEIALVLCGSLLLLLVTAVACRLCRKESLETKLRELETREEQSFRDLRTIRRQLADVRAEAAQRAADAEAKAEASADRARARALSARRWCCCVRTRARSLEPDVPRAIVLRKEEEEIRVPPQLVESPLIGHRSIAHSGLP